MGNCNTCGYSPLATDARFCPRCMAKDPNPNLLKIIIGWLFLGFIVFVVLGGLVGAILDKSLSSSGPSPTNGVDTDDPDDVRFGLGGLDTTPSGWEGRSNDDIRSFRTASGDEGAW